MNIIPNHQLPVAVAAELSALGARHVLARLTAQSPASVQRVPAWYALRGRPCAEPAASERWERVDIDAATHPALAAWLAADEENTEPREEHDARALNARRIDAVNTPADGYAACLCGWPRRAPRGVDANAWLREWDAADSTPRLPEDAARLAHMRAAREAGTL